jgi:hypothetical protein
MSKFILMAGLSRMKISNALNELFLIFLQMTLSNKDIASMSPLALHHQGAKVHRGET